MSADIKAWAGDNLEVENSKGAVNDPQIVGLSKQVPRIEVRSDEFVVTVVGPVR